MPQINRKKKPLKDNLAIAVTKNTGAIISIVTTELINQILGFRDISDMQISKEDIENLHKTLKTFVERKIYNRNKATYDALLHEKIIENKEKILKLILIEMLTTYITEYYSDEDIVLLHMIQQHLDMDLIDISIERGHRTTTIRVKMPSSDEIQSDAINDITHDRNGETSDGMYR